MEQGNLGEYMITLELCILIMAVCFVGGVAVGYLAFAPIKGD